MTCFQKLQKLQLDTTQKEIQQMRSEIEKPYSFSSINISQKNFKKIKDLKLSALLNQEQ